MDQNNFAYSFLYKYKCFGGLYKKTFFPLEVSNCMKAKNPLIYQNECLRNYESKYGTTDIFGIEKVAGLTRSKVRFEITASIDFVENKEYHLHNQKKIEEFACKNVNVGFQFNSTRSEKLKTIIGQVYSGSKIR